MIDLKLNSYVPSFVYNAAKTLHDEFISTVAEGIDLCRIARIRAQVFGKSQKQRFELARERISTDRASIERFIPLYGIQDENKRYELYQLAERLGFCPSLANFNLSDKQHYKLAKTLTTGKLSRLIPELRLKNHQIKRIFNKHVHSPERDDFTLSVLANHLLQTHPTLFSDQEIIHMGKKFKSQAIHFMPSLQNEKERYLWAKENVFSLTSFFNGIKKLNLSPQHRFDIAKKLADARVSLSLSDLIEFDLTPTEIEKILPFLQPSQVTAQDLEKLNLANPVDFFQKLIAKNFSSIAFCSIDPENEPIPNENRPLLQLPKEFANSKKLINLIYQNQLTNFDGPARELCTKLFLPLFEKYPNHAHSVFNLESWSKLLAWRYSFTEESPKFQKLAALSEHLLKWGTENERACMSLIFIAAFFDRTIFDFWFQHTPQVNHCMVPSAFYATLKPGISSYRSWTTQLARARQNLRFGPNEKKLAHYLDRIGDSKRSVKEKQILLEHLFFQEELPSQRAVVLSDLLTFNPTYLLKKKNLNLPTLQLERRKAFMEAFGVEGEENQTKMDQLIESFRDKEALATYLAKIYELKDIEKYPLLRHYRTWVKTLLDGSFSTWRSENSAHLKKLLALGATPKLLTDWKEGGPIQKASFYGRPSTEERHIRLKEFLQEKLLRDGHITDFEQLHPALASFLRDKPVPLEIDDFAKQVIDLCKPGVELPNIKSFAAAIKEKYGNLFYDLEEFIQQEKALSSIPDAERTYALFDSEDPQDLFLLASETGGCQSIYGSADLNKNALAYVTDGKNRAIVLKDPANGKLISRAVLRLLWDDTAKKPALFVERIYSSYPDPRFRNVILTYAKQRAQTLGLSLFAQPPKEIPDAHSLESFGSSAPFEYSDAGGGQTKGLFTISAQLIPPLSSETPLDAEEKNHN